MAFKGGNYEQKPTHPSLRPPLGWNFIAMALPWCLIPQIGGLG
jgi:hypothetical protein